MPGMNAQTGTDRPLDADAQGGNPEWFDPTHFTVTIDEMYPERYGPRNSLWEFSLTMRGDSALVYLPYMGQMQVPVFDFDGLNFEHRYRDLKVGATRRGDGVVLTFAVRHQTMAYTFVVTAFANHHADIVVIPSGADRCRYTGRWESTQAITEVVSEEKERTQSAERAINYVALVLDEQSQSRLKELAAAHMPWADATIRCHHMTIAHHTNMNDSILAWVSAHEGETFSITATHYGHTDKALAVKVDAGVVPSMNALTHVTLAFNPSAGGSAVDSNYITTWTTMPEPIELTGTVAVVY